MICSCSISAKSFARWESSSVDRAQATGDISAKRAAAVIHVRKLLTIVAPTPPREMIVAGAITVSLTPALSQRERKIRSALRATFIVSEDWRTGWFMGFDVVRMLNVSIPVYP